MVHTLNAVHPGRAGLWMWLELPGAQLGVPQGWLRAADVERFVEASDVVAQMDAALGEIRERGQAQAQACLADAQARADQILAEAAAEAQAIMTRVHEEAGRQARQEVLQDWHARRLDVVLAQAASLEAQRDGLARLVTTAVERVLRAEPARGLFDKALAHVGELMRDATGATLRVHADEVDMARAAVDDAQRHEGSRARIEVVSDQRLHPGACVFDSAQGSLDASLEVQLAALRGAIEQACIRFTLAQTQPSLAMADSRPPHDSPTLEPSPP